MTPVIRAHDPRLMETIVADYSEMPGLALTVAQACRLWNCDVESLWRVADVLGA